MSETKRPTTEAAEEILGKYFPVLDHGFVSLIDYMGSDTCIEQAARVSYGAGTRKQSATRGLLRYLKRHLHSTPAEMVELKFHCCMPIFIARQMIRHRSANVNEYSGRYSLMPMIFYTPEYERLQKQSKGNNQGSSDETVSEEYYNDTVNKWNNIRNQNVELYQSMTEDDVARELARIDLPLSTYTQWYWKIDLHNLLHFLTLRVDSHAQWEIQEYGKVMAGMLKRVAPIMYEAWIDYDVCGERMSFMEMEIIRDILEYTKYKEDGKSLDIMPNGRYLLLDENETEMSSREMKEFAEKMSKRMEKPDFELDLSKAKSAEYFENIMKEAVK